VFGRFRSGNEIARPAKYEWQAQGAQVRSNDYLDLSTTPRSGRPLASALQKYRQRLQRSRLLNGTPLDLHVKVEAQWPPSSTKRPPSSSASGFRPTTPRSSPQAEKGDVLLCDHNSPSQPGGRRVAFGGAARCAYRHQRHGTHLERLPGEHAAFRTHHDRLRRRVQYGGRYRRAEGISSSPGRTGAPLSSTRPHGIGVWGRPAPGPPNIWRARRSRISSWGPSQVAASVGGSWPPPAT